MDNCGNIADLIRRMADGDGKLPSQASITHDFNTGETETIIGCHHSASHSFKTFYPDTRNLAERFANLNNTEDIECEVIETKLKTK